jgi:hypothetical protein
MANKILDKILKLLAHRDSAEKIGSKNEAEAFSAKIQQLIDEYNLSMTDIEIHAAENSPIAAEVVYREPTDIKDWQAILLDTIARVNGCFGVMNTAGFFFVVGRETDRKLAINFFKHFDQVCQRLAQEFEPESDGVMHVTMSDSRGYSTSTTTIWVPASILAFYGGPSEETQRRSYIYGIVNTICERLEETHAHDMRKVVNDTALVFLNKRSPEAEAWARKKGEIESRPIEQQVDERSYLKGVEAAEDLALSQGELGAGA